MKLRFQCGCPPVEINVDKVAPKCPACGNRRVVRVLGDSRPRIVGHGRGPLVQSKALEPIPVVLAPAGALKVRPRKEAE